jgi:hypothetical protein
MEFNSALKVLNCKNVLSSPQFALSETSLCEEHGAFLIYTATIKRAGGWHSTFGYTPYANSLAIFPVYRNALKRWN